MAHFDPLNAAWERKCNDLLMEIERLQQRWEFLESRFQACCPKMGGDFAWRYANHWPPLVGKSFSEAVDSAILLLGDTSGA